jgi:HSP20 family protein
MADQQGKRQGEMMTRAGEGERGGLATRQYRDPFSLLDSLFDRMQRDFFGTTLLGALLPREGAEGERGMPRVPRVQMRDTADALVVTAEMPGLAASDVKIELQDDVLTLHGETRHEEQIEGESIERYVSFYRQVRLPEGLDVDQAEASYANGVLSIKFPKRAERSNVRQIPVSTEPGAQKQQPQQPAKQKAA